MKWTRPFTIRYRSMRWSAVEADRPPEVETTGPICTVAMIPSGVDSIPTRKPPQLLILNRGLLDSQLKWLNRFSGKRWAAAMRFATSVASLGGDFQSGCILT